MRTSWDPAGHTISEGLDQCPRRATTQALGVVDDEDERRAALGHRTLQARDEHAREVDGDGRESLPRAGLQWLELVERPHHVRQQHGGVIVLTGHGHPGREPRIAVQPLGNQRGLAEAAATDDEDDGNVGRSAQLVDQPRPLDQPGSRPCPRRARCAHRALCPVPHAPIQSTLESVRGGHASDVANNTNVTFAGNGHRSGHRPGRCFDPPHPGGASPTSGNIDALHPGSLGDPKPQAARPRCRRCVHGPAARPEEITNAAKMSFVNAATWATAPASSISLGAVRLDHDIDEAGANATT